MRALLAFALLAGCTDEDHVIELAVLERGGQGTFIDVPTTASIGETVHVRFMTEAGGCVRGDRTDVMLTEAGAEISPYDRRSTGEGECPLDLQIVVREAELVFDTPGPKTVRVLGRRVDGDIDEPIAIELPIDVR